MLLYPIPFATVDLNGYSPASVTQSNATRLDRKQQEDKLVPSVPSETNVSISLSAVKRQQTSMSTNQVIFEVNGDSDEIVIKVLDKKSGEVVRQIPSKTSIQLTERIQKHQRDFFNLG